MPDARSLDLTEARTHLQRLVDRAKRRASVQLPIGFVKGGPGDPPLARLLGGGQSGEVRLKLFLTYVMRATAKPYGTRALYTVDVARALGLPDPEDKGVRRVQAAVRWLKANQFLADTTDEKGRPQIQVLNPMTPGGEGLTPWPGRGDGNRYLTVPIELWSNSWICVLSGRALVLYLVLKELTGGRDDRRWTDPGRKKLYGLSSSTWSRATTELADFGLLTLEKRNVRDDYAVARLRNTYKLNEEVIRDMTPEQVSSLGRPERRA
jgi:hypothetical protein